MTGFAKSHYLEQKILEGFLRNTAIAVPAVVYAALLTVPCTDQGGGTEVSAGGTAYARQPVTFAASSNNGALSGSLCANGVAVTYPVATAPYGSVICIGLYDALTNGNLLWYGAPTASITVGTGDQVVIPIGDIVVGED